MNLNSDKLAQSVVYLCGFECFIHQANVSIKFPCNYFIQWRTSNSKFFSKSERRNPIRDKVIFNESIRLTLQMIHDNARNQFLKRQTIIELFLNSKSRPSESKLVGRVNIEVSNIINHSAFALPTIFKLEFCSIEASLLLNFRFLSKSPSSVTAASLDRSSIAEYIAKAQSIPPIKSQSLVLSKFKNLNFQDQKRQTNDKDRQEKMQIQKEQQYSELSILSQSLLTNQDKVAKYQKTQEVYQYLNGNRIDKIKLRQFFILTEQKQENMLYQIEQGNPLQEQSLNQTQSLQQLKKQLREAKQEITTLTNLYEQQRQDFWHAESISGTLSQINAKIQDQKQILNIQLDTYRKNNQQVQNKNSALMQRIFFLENSSATLQKQKAQLKILNEKSYENLKIYGQQIARLQAQITALTISKKASSQMQLKIQGLQLQIHLQAKKLQQTEEVIIAYQSKFLQLQLLVQKLQKQNGECNQRVRESEQIQIQLRKKINELDLQINLLSNSLERFEAQKIEGEIEAKQRQNIIQSLLLQVKEAERKITQSYRVPASNMPNLEVEQDQKWMQKCRSLQQECSQLKKSIQTLMANFEEVVSQNNELQHQLMLAQEKESLITQSIKNLENQRAQAQIKFQQMAQRASQDQEEILSLKNQMKKAVFFQKRESSRPWLSPPRAVQGQSVRQELVRQSKVLAESNLEMKRKVKDLSEKIGQLVLKHNQTRRRLQNEIQKLKDQLIESRSHNSSLQSVPSCYIDP